MNMTLPSGVALSSPLVYFFCYQYTWRLEQLHFPVPLTTLLLIPYVMKLQVAANYVAMVPSGQIFDR